MTESPYDAPSSVVVPTENVEKPLRKRATWRKRAVVLAVVMALPAAGVALLHFMLSIRFDVSAKNKTSGLEPAVNLIIATHPLTLDAVYMADMADSLLNPGPASASSSISRRPEKKANRINEMVGLALIITWFPEWFFYGWLLDTWSYHRRLAKSLASKQLA